MPVNLMFNPQRYGRPKGVGDIRDNQTNGLSGIGGQAPGNDAGLVIKGFNRGQETPALSATSCILALAIESPRPSNQPIENWKSE